jgi:CHAT domain-containing protein
MSARAGSLLVAALVLAACQTTMSVEEARKVTAEFASTAFVPPPRTIEDITAILDQQKPAPAAAAAARARADQAPPQSADRAVLTRFYFDRAMAAREIGRAKQEIDDLTAALGHTGPGAPVPDYEILFNLGLAELSGGSYSRSVAQRLRAIAAVPPNQRGWLITLHGGLATMHASWGDLKAAEEAFAATRQVYSESLRWTNQRPEWLTSRQVWLANAEAAILEARGQHGAAETLYRRARAVLANDPVFARHTWIDWHHTSLAQALVRQGRLLEAENEARQAVLGALAKRGRYSSHCARQLRTLVWVILEQGRYAEAETLARAVVDIYEKVGAARESVLFAGARGQLATALAFQSRHREALAEYETIRAALAGDPESARKFLEGHVGYAVSLLRTGDPDRALPILGVALEKARRLVGDRHPNTAGVRGWIAQAHLAKGDRARALKEFREATEILLARTVDADDESATRAAADQRLTVMLGFYVGLLADIRGSSLEREAGIDAAAEAFRLAEVVRGRSVERALDASAARAVAQTPALADLVRREQDARKQMAALQGLLRNVLSEPSERQSARVIDDLRSQIETLGRARLSLTRQIEREFPTYAQLVNPAPATLGQARASLAPGEALVSVVVLRNRTFVWAVPWQGPVAFAAAPLGARALEATVAGLRKALDPGARTLGEVPDFDVAAAHDLYRALLEPVAAGWRHASHLIVVPHGPLGHLPFSLLVTRPTTLGAEEEPLFAKYRRVPWLIRTHAVTVLPSVGALGTLRRLPAADRARRPFVGFGDPYFSVEQARRAARPREAGEAAALTARGGAITLRNLKVEKAHSARLGILPRLPDTADEIQSIAGALRADPARDVFLGAEANERRVKTMNLAGYRVIAFATHGLVPGDLDGLTQPALALSAPEVAGVDGDGLLTMEEILALRLDADWVVLSACNTASGEGSGSEAISGLGRAFFYAGARALLVSNWPVETTSARALTTELFRRQAADPRLARAAALQQTMNALIDEGRFVDPATKSVVFSYAHPIFWAPFTLVGDGGGPRATEIR